MHVRSHSKIYYDVTLVTVNLSLFCIDGYQLTDTCFVAQSSVKQEGQHPLTGQRAANFRRDLGAT